jgi:transposase
VRGPAGGNPAGHSPAGRPARGTLHQRRALTVLEETSHQGGAKALKGLLLEMKAAVEPARTRGDARRPAAARPPGVTRSAELRAAGRAANPPPVRPPGHRGRRIKQSPVPPRRERWGLGERAGLAFLDDLAIPVDNHQAEQDLRRLKVQQQLAGSFRADTGAAAVARIRGYLSSLRKPGGARLAALHSVFSGQPLYPALG